MAPLSSDEDGFGTVGLKSLWFWVWWWRSTSFVHSQKMPWLFLLGGGCIIHIYIRLSDDDDIVPTYPRVHFVATGDVGTANTRFKVTCLSKMFIFLLASKSLCLA